MIVDRFSSLAELRSIGSRWEELYQRDPEASLFLSWDWIVACLASEKRRWIVLGVRDGDLPHSAFLPLSYAPVSFSGRVLSLGPSPRADFTGMVGAPGDEEHYIPALAEEIRRLPWDSLALNNCADRRIESLIREFDTSCFRVVAGDPTPCPYIQLPATWDDYLKSRGSSTRRTIRSHLNRIRSLPGYSLVFTPPHKALQAIETLLQLHSLRWKRKLTKTRQDFRDFLALCAASNRFLVCVMHQGDKVIAVQGLFVEQERRTTVAYMIAHNPEYAQYSPGVMLTCESIRHAIENRYDYYSLSRGEQGYKMSLVTDVQYLTNTLVWRRNIRAAAIDRGQRAFSAVKKLIRKVLRSDLDLARRTRG